jgi:hypothetical protein
MIKIRPSFGEDKIDRVAITVCFDQLDYVGILETLNVFDVRPLKEG